jgi:hypothetical protein
MRGRHTLLGSAHPEMGERLFLLATPQAGGLPKRPMWCAGVGLRRRTISAVRAAMDGSPREAETRPQPEVTFKFQKNWHFRMDTR